MRSVDARSSALIMTTVKEKIIPIAASLLGGRPALTGSSGTGSGKKKTNIIAQLLIFWPLGVFFAFVRTVYSTVSISGAPRVLLLSSLSELRRFAISLAYRSIHRILSWMFFPHRVAFAVLQYFLFLLLWAAPAYFRSSNLYQKDTLLLREIPYGPKSWHKMDIYLPKGDVRQGDNLDVIVLYVSVGWSISRRSTSVAFARALANMIEGLVVVVEIGTHPQCNVAEMVDDVKSSLCFIKTKIHEFGGNPKSLHGVGVSSGANLLLLALLSYPEKKEELELSSMSLVSGVYDPAMLREHSAASGMFSSFRTVARVFPTVELAKCYSVDRMLEELIESKGIVEAIAMFPSRTSIFHGSCDTRYPLRYVRLHALMPTWQLHIYDRYTHNEPMIEALLCDGKARLVQDIAKMVVSSSQAQSPTTSPISLGQTGPPSGKGKSPHSSTERRTHGHGRREGSLGHRKALVGTREWVQVQIQTKKRSSRCKTWEWWGRATAVRWLSGY